MNNIEKSSAFGGYWKDFEKEVCTPEEIEESRLRVALISEKIKRKNNKTFLQTDTIVHVLEKEQGIGV